MQIHHQRNLIATAFPKYQNMKYSKEMSPFEMRPSIIMGKKSTVMLPKAPRECERVCSSGQKEATLPSTHLGCGSQYSPEGGSRV